MIKKPDKRQQRIEKTFERFKTMNIDAIFNRKKTGLAVLLQKLVRLAHADDSGFVQCVTCGNVKHWKQMNGGHYVGRKNKATIISPLNVWPQCCWCNDHKSGNLGAYRAFLQENIGNEALQELEAMKLPANHIWDRMELAEEYVNLQDEIKAHERRLGV